MPLQSFSGILCFPNFCLFSTYVKRIPQHIKHHVRCRRTFQSINRKLKQINRIWTDGPRRFLGANMIFSCTTSMLFVLLLGHYTGNTLGWVVRALFIFWHWHVNRWRFCEVSRACIGATRDSAGGVVAMRAAAGMTRREQDGDGSASGRALYYATQSNVARDKVHSFFAMQHDFISLFADGLDIAGLWFVCVSVQILCIYFEVNFSLQLAGVCSRCYNFGVNAEKYQNSKLTIFTI